MSNSNWYKLDDAYKILNKPSRQALYKWLMIKKAERVAKIGVHIKPMHSKSKRVTWLVNIEAVDRL